MSSGLKVHLRELSKQADRLQAEVVDLAEGLASVLTPGAFGDWVLVDDAYPPLPIEEFRALQSLQRFKGIEEGYPDLPPECLRIVARALDCEPEEAVARAHKAYVSGFLAELALSTSTTYERSAKLGDKDICHWVVFYKYTPTINRRLSSQKCLEIAITVEKDCIWEGFKSIAELTVFCAGAGKIVPKLDKWISPW